MPDTERKRSPLAAVRLALWIAVGIAALLAGMLLLMRPGREQAEVRQTELRTIGGRFTLTGADGRPFSSESLAGKPHAVFFGFTNCPDVCPTTLARLVRLRRSLGRDFTILFISVDPERDTPQAVGRYVALFDEPIVGLTGSPQQIEQVKKQFAVHSARGESSAEGYSVDHTAAVLLFDKAGRFTSTISAEEGDAPALDKLRRITA